eukprot:CAMPEP_0177525752 /NCGR_PEP_ID=MMETSP0369-20130122/50713_1 /TAXON_ID=447022 ORGANISM="Scrippsiella hangoei-like, Strain SHHI-4" /NCGR_SAMPLE_ID=MMETSP0369 /ASSEMBLY_ACC=CAM_ASM_000364 /LENGTH=61 /DNA_ID=CAMNT_0019005921 /DNA_START=105 /DNA_END=287 /DNA_ORIENTATION=+
MMGMSYQPKQEALQLAPPSPIVDQGSGGRMVRLNLATNRTSSPPCLGTRPYERHRLLNRAV